MGILERGHENLGNSGKTRGNLGKYWEMDIKMCELWEETEAEMLGNIGNEKNGAGCGASPGSLRNGR